MPQRNEGFREYCGAQDPNRTRRNAACVLSKGHSPDVQHRDLDGTRWSDSDKVEEEPR